MAIADADGAPVRAGIRVVLGTPLLRGCANVNRPIGDIVAVDQTNTGRECNMLEDFGQRVLLVYGEP
jgi:hypothetical protein